MRYVYTVTVILLLVSQLIASSAPPPQTDLDEEVEALLGQMSPQERVGQLFLVTFHGSDVSAESDIGKLITEYRVGGVVLLAENDNITDETSTVQSVYLLTTNLQRLAEGGTPAAESDATDATIAPEPGPFIPLLIGVEHEGTGAEHMVIMSGLTPLPSNMAVGATWNPTRAQDVGVITGQELAALGINLLIGPPADVVEPPLPSTTGDLGTRVFGGEPYWVSQMTAAYVRGVHIGSNSRVAVAPVHFPGQGSADRSASDEIPSVLRSLDTLIKYDLQPYFAVMGAPQVDDLTRAEGVMTGHIRYQGFTGTNPRLSTEPISLDPQALQQELMPLPSIAPWRQAGGLLISDSLGLSGVQKYYDPRELEFNNRRIAQLAFQAGNDILYLGNFGGDTPAEQMQAVTDTIEFFAATYDEDETFQARVDSAVRRILRMKLDLYGGQFLLSNVLPSSEGLSLVGEQHQVTANVAQEALTLLSPGASNQELSPQREDHILIFTDTRTTAQCSTCTPQRLIAVDALQHAILTRYGPSGTGVIRLGNVQSFSFEDLMRYLNDRGSAAASTDETPTPDPLAIAIDSADWVVFLMLDVTNEIPSSLAIKQFLANPPVSSNTRIIGMALGAPYYLDATEVSKLTAYYGLYGYTRPFIDVGALALFQGVIPTTGASPVSIRALDYYIIEATKPNPNQKITLTYTIQPTGQVATQEATPTVTPEITREDTIVVTTGVILDHNGHPVPDGTPVEFRLTNDEGYREPIQVTTIDGVAQARIDLLTIQLELPDVITISAVSPPALISDEVQVSIRETGQVDVGLLTPSDSVLSPTTEATATPAAPTPTPVSVAPTATPAETPIPTAPSVDFADLYFALFGLLGMSVAIFVYGLNGRDMNYGLLLALPTTLFGLLGYNYYALMLPGSAPWRQVVAKPWAAALSTWIGAFIGLAVTTLFLGAWGKWIRVSLRRRQFGREESRKNRHQ